jgi:phenazine biosynthesis protein phzE
VGATLVRHSDPAAEVAETRGKAAALLDTLAAGDRPAPRRPAGRLMQGQATRRILQTRNDRLSRFWLAPPGRRRSPVVPDLVGRRLLLIDAEDDFTAMLAQQIRAVGPSVVLRRFDQPGELRGWTPLSWGPAPEPRTTKPSPVWPSCGS